VSFKVLEHIVLRVLPVVVVVRGRETLHVQIKKYYQHVRQQYITKTYNVQQPHVQELVVMVEHVQTS
jgi:hypothetical protein